jgi:hypothetical protein
MAIHVLNEHVDITLVLCHEKSLDLAIDRMVILEKTLVHTLAER